MQVPSFRRENENKSTDDLRIKMITYVINKYVKQFSTVMTTTILSKYLSLDNPCVRSTYNKWCFPTIL